MKMAVNAKNWQELKKPNALEKKVGGGDSASRAVFVAEPLERGFGMNLGNSLRRLLLSATGPTEVTAGMIATTGDIEITNPELMICHLDEGATLNMELTVDIGKGYQPAIANRPVDAPIGLIPVDALYSPVRQVAYKVENTRVGQELDYDKLTLTIETDGTVTPEDALGYAARILQDQLQLFVHFDEGQVRMAPSPMMGSAAPMAAE